MVASFDPSIFGSACSHVVDHGERDIFDDFDHVI